MKKPKIIFTLIAVLFLVSCIFVKTASKNAIPFRASDAEILVTDYLEKLKSNKISEALDLFYFSQKDIDEGLKQMTLEAMQDNFVCKEYQINTVEQINEHIFLVKATINTNDGTGDPNIFEDTEFNPYVCIINEKLYIVPTKYRIPNALYDDNDNIPDNYDNYEDIAY